MLTSGEYLAAVLLPERFAVPRADGGCGGSDAEPVIGELACVACCPDRLTTSGDHLPPRNGLAAAAPLPAGTDPG